MQELDALGHQRRAVAVEQRHGVVEEHARLAGRECAARLVALADVVDGRLRCFVV